MTAELLAQFGYLVQIMGAMMVTFLAFLTHVGASPYVNRKLYRLDSAALLISLGTFSLGAFQAEDMPDWAQIVVAGLVIATNVGFLLFVAFYVRREIIFYIHECVDDLRDLFGLCCSCCRRARADSATSSDALTPKTKSLEDGDGDGSHRSKRSRRGRSKGGQGVDTPNPVMQMEMEMVSREGSSGSTGRPTRGSGSSDDSHASHGVRDTATAAHAAPPSPALAPSSKPPNVPPPTAPTMPPPAASRRDRRARHGSSGSHATEDASMHRVLRANWWPLNQWRQRVLPFSMLRVAFTRNIARARQLAKRYSLPSRTANMLGFAGGPRLSRLHVSSVEMPNAQKPPHCGS